MRLYVALTPEKEVFDPTRHQREDVSVFHFSLTHPEGDAATAFLEVPNRLGDLSAFSDQKHVLISTTRQTGEAVCLFQGCFHALVKRQGNRVVLAFTARPDDADPQLQRLAAPYAGDPLFASKLHPEDPADILKAQEAVVYFDPRTHTVSLSSLFEGRSFIDVGSRFYSDSLHIKPGAPSLAAVEVTLEVQWIQKKRGYASLSQKIADAFPEQIINTFTGARFSKKWPKTGQILRHTGYWVAQSHLEEIAPPPTGALNLYPPYSAPLSFLNKYGDLTTGRAKRSWFKGELLVGWAYRQKRVERLTFTLTQNLHPFFAGSATPLEKVHLLLGEISPRQSCPFWTPTTPYDVGFKIQEEGKIYRCLKNHRSAQQFSPEKWVFEKNMPTALGSESRSSFFVTQRGYTVFEQALDRAKAYLATRARGLLISFSAPWESLCDVSCDHTLALQDPRLPGGALRGKVVSTTLVADGQTGERRVDVTLAVSLGFRKSTAVFKALPPYATSYTENLYTADESTPPTSAGGLTYRRYDTQTPEEPVRPSPHTLIKNLVLRNPAQTQEDFLQTQQYPQGHIGPSTLKDCATSLRLDLYPLSSKEALEHHIKAEILSIWSAPLHIGVH